jgi:hypothetical protein
MKPRFVVVLIGSLILAGGYRDNPQEPSLSFQGTLEGNIVR